MLSAKIFHGLDKVFLAVGRVEKAIARGRLVADAHKGNVMRLSALDIAENAARHAALPHDAHQFLTAPVDTRNRNVPLFKIAHHSRKRCAVCPLIGENAAHGLIDRLNRYATPRGVLRVVNRNPAAAIKRGGITPIRKIAQIILIF